MSSPWDPKENGRIPIKDFEEPTLSTEYFIDQNSSRSGLILKNLGPMRRRRQRTSEMQKKMKNIVI